MYEWIEEAFRVIVKYSMLLLELAGVVIIVFSAVKAAVGVLRGKKEGASLALGQGIALALSFLLGSEVMRTIIVPSTQDLIITGALVVMRAAMTILIHWEIKNEKAEEKERE